MRRSYAWVALGLALALTITLFAPFASSKPDGLERVAEDKGFVEEAKAPPYQVIADYAFPWVGNERAATILAGITGTVVVFAVVIGSAYALSRRGASPQSPGNGKR